MSRSSKAASRPSGGMAGAQWDLRLVEVDAEAVRYRMAAKRLRLGKQQVRMLHDRVATALEAELESLQALEAEAIRQQQQQHNASKYG